MDWAIILPAIILPDQHRVVPAKVRVVRQEDRMSESLCFGRLESPWRLFVLLIFCSLTSFPPDRIEVNVGRQKSDSDGYSV